MVFVALRFNERFGLLPHLRDWFSLRCRTELNLFWEGDEGMLPDGLRKYGVTTLAGHTYFRSQHFSNMYGARDFSHFTRAPCTHASLHHFSSKPSMHSKNGRSVHKFVHCLGTPWAALGNELAQCQFIVPVHFQEQPKACSSSVRTCAHLCTDLPFAVMCRVHCLDQYKSKQ